MISLGRRNFPIKPGFRLIQTPFWTDVIVSPMNNALWPLLVPFKRNFSAKYKIKYAVYTLHETIKFPI